MEKFIKIGEILFESHKYADDALEALKTLGYEVCYCGFNDDIYKYIIMVEKE